MAEGWSPAPPATKAFQLLNWALSHLPPHPLSRVGLGAYKSSHTGICSLSLGVQAAPNTTGGPGADISSSLAPPPPCGCYSSSPSCWHLQSIFIWLGPPSPKLQELEALLDLAPAPGNSSKVPQGPQDNRCWFSRPFHSSGWGEGWRLSSPQQYGQGLGQPLGASRAGAGPWGMRVFKVSSGRLLSYKLTTCLTLDTAVTMWFLVLCIALTLWGTGAAPPIYPRIIGGWECKPHSQPWQVAVYNYNRPVCGGVLIDTKWVLTAAHCTSQNYQIWLGRHKLNSSSEPIQYAQVSGIFPHPDFSKTAPDPFEQEDYSNDLMLLRLKGPVKITDAVQVLALPTQEPQVGSTCLASGWGSMDPEGKVFPRELHCVDINIYPNDVCAKAHPYKITDKMLCAGDIKGGKDTCVGDSGGPLICDGIFQGILSWGDNPCATVGKPAIFTRVFSFLDWIHDTMAANP